MQIGYRTQYAIDQDASSDPTNLPQNDVRGLKDESGMIPPQARLYFVVSSGVCSRGVENHSEQPKAGNCYTGYK